MKTEKLFNICFFSNFVCCAKQNFSSETAQANGTRASVCGRKADSLRCPELRRWSLDKSGGMKTDLKKVLRFNEELLIITLC
jgi:hypothetical protein